MDPYQQYPQQQQPSQQPPVQQQYPQPPQMNPAPQFEVAPAPHKNTALVISAVLLGLLAAVFAGTTIWAYMKYNEKATDVDGQISLAKADAEKAQSDKDQKKYNELLQQPYSEFVGPDDYGRLTFNYPKTWSVYVASDVTATGGDYTAYLNPVTVPPVSKQTQYALHLTITSKDYPTVLKMYDGLIKTGKLTSSATSANGQNGTRFDGNFTKDIRGAAVIYKIRDKTLIMQTDADTFKPKFEEIIKTIKFNT